MRQTQSEYTVIQMEVAKQVTEMVFLLIVGISLEWFTLTATQM